MTLTRQCGGEGKGDFAAFPFSLMTALAVISSASEKSLFERKQRFTIVITMNISTKIKPRRGETKSERLDPKQKAQAAMLKSHKFLPHSNP
jgi:hypothetical protein